eukprot:768514-Hanusia_phi.AAC.4
MSGLLSSSSSVLVPLLPSPPRAPHQHRHRLNHPFQIENKSVTEIVTFVVTGIGGNGERKVSRGEAGRERRWRRKGEAKEEEEISTR